jgi:hypothetical protein
MKLHMSVHCHPNLFILQACSASLHKIILPELKIEKSFSAITGQTVGGISTKIHTSSIPSLVVHITASSALLHKMAVRAINRKF